MTPQILLGKQFDSIEALRQACCYHAIENNFEFQTLMSNRSRYTIKCKAEDCHWRLHATAAKNRSVFEIRTLQADHSCFGVNHKENNVIMSTFIANHILKKLKQQPEYRPIDIVKD